MNTKRILIIPGAVLSLFFSTLAFPQSRGKGADKAEKWVDPIEVLKIGKAGDRQAIPFLRRVKEGKEKHQRSAGWNAQMALAKLGEKKEMDEIIEEVQSTDPEIQDGAIQKLTYVANKRAIQALLKLLDDPAKYKRKKERGADGELHWSDVVYEPPSYQAVRALNKILPQGPKLRKKFVTKNDVKSWKEWLKKNPEHYEDTPGQQDDVGPNSPKSGGEQNPPKRKANPEGDTQKGQ